MGLSKVLDGKMTLEQSGKLANMMHHLVTKVNLPYGKVGKLDYDRVVRGLQELAEVGARFQGWQREVFQASILPFDGPYRHRDILYERGQEVGGVFAGVGMASIDLLGVSTRVKQKLSEKIDFDCIVVTPGEMGFQERKIPFWRVLERGMECGLEEISASYAPQGLVVALSTMILKDPDSLLAAMTPIKVEHGSWAFAIRTDEGTEKYPYMFSRYNAFQAVEKDQAMLWRITVKDEVQGED